jgi:hypothetical protein
MKLQALWTAIRAWRMAFQPMPRDAPRHLWRFSSKPAKKGIAGNRRHWGAAGLPLRMAYSA